MPEGTPRPAIRGAGPRRALALAAAAALLSLPGIPPAGAASCTFSGGVVGVALPAGGSVTVARDAAGRILVDGAPCGGATVVTTARVEVTGAGGDERVTLDQTAGRLEPGAGAGEGIPEVEVELSLGAGRDTLAVVGTPGPDRVVLGGAGIDLNGDGDADVTGAGVAITEVRTAGGDDVVSAAGGPGVGIALGWRVVLDGGPGDDRLTGGRVGDTLAGGTGTNVLDGGAGLDTVTYAWAAGPVVLDLAAGRATGPADDTLAGIEYAVGSPFADVLAGNAGANLLRGGDGDDTLRGQGGADTLEGGSGDDTLDEGPVANGPDRLAGGAGRDTVDYSARAAPVTATADGVADDGEAGEGDDVRPDVEAVRLPVSVPLPCGDPGRWLGAAPLASGDGDVLSIHATSDVPGSLAASGTLYLRIRFAGAVLPKHRVFIDADDDRYTGMWTGQWRASASAWDLMVAPTGVLFRHAGRPNQWSWTKIEPPGYRRVAAGATLDLCLPIGVLGATPPPRVRVAAETTEGSLSWLPLRFLPGAAYPPVAEAAPAEPAGPPEPMAFNSSGAPWVVRECTDLSPATMACPAEVYGHFGHVVLGAGLELDTHPGHDRAARMIGAIRAAHPGTEVWGYLSWIGEPDGNGDGRRDSIYTREQIVARAAAWGAMGATGVFLDEYRLCEPAWENCPLGPDGQELWRTRADQTAVVGGIHQGGLAVMVNGASVHDAVGEVGGVPSPLGPGAAGRPADMFLFENPTMAAGVWRTVHNWDGGSAKLQLAGVLRQRTGVRMAAIDSWSTVVPDSGVTWPEYRAGWWRAAQAGLDGYAFVSGVFSSEWELPILGPPPEAAGGYGATLAPGGLSMSLDGWRSERLVLDATGRAVSLIRVTRTGDDGRMVSELIRL